MSTAAAKKLTLNLLVDKERNRVVFAESDEDFVDILFSFLTLPLGTVVRLTGEKSSLGCVDRLYESVKNLDEQYLQTPACKTMLLFPRSSSGIECEGLALRVDDSDHRVYYRCASRLESCKISSVPGVRCACGKPTDTPFARPDTAGGEGADGVFVKGTLRFMITDDLKVMPVSIGASLSLLKTLGIEDGSVLEKRTVELGTDEILSLLKQSLVSMMPLTDVFLEEPQMISDAEKMMMTEITHGRRKQQKTTTDKRISVKLFLSRESDKVVYAEAGEDFIDLLFSFLTFPLGSIVKILEKCSYMGCLDNLYKSIELLSIGNDYLKSEYHKNMLLEPKLAPYYGCNSQLLRIDEKDSQIFTLPQKKCSCQFFRCSHGLQEMNPKLKNSNMEYGGGFAKGMVRYMVTDEMVVTPLSPISGVSIINKLMVPISSLEEAEASLGEAEALSLLKACLISPTVLSDVFSPTLLTILEQKWCGRFS